MITLCTYTASYIMTAKSRHLVLQVSVDNIDQDLFRTGVRGGSFQPSDDTLHAIKTKAISLLNDAYQKDLVCTHTPPVPSQLARHAVWRDTSGKKVYY